MPTQSTGFAPFSLPERPLAVSPDSVRPPRGLIVALLVMLALLAGMAIWQGPGLWRDLQILHNPVTLHDGQVIDGECTTRRGITDCSARLVYDFKGQSYDTVSGMAFVDFGSGDYLVDIVISGDRPELATMSIGIEKIWNRVIVFAAAVLLFGGGMVATMRQWLRARRHRRDWQGSGRLALVPVTITQVHRQRGAVTVSYRDGSGPVTVTRFTGPAGPLTLPDAVGAATGIAVRRDGGAQPVLLDEGLDRLDLTADERAAALSQIAVLTGAAENRPAPRRRRTWLRALVAVLVAAVVLVAAGLGYWLWYVTSGDAFNSPGKEINAILPAALSDWGCEQLHARFPKSHPPLGCVGADFSTWR